MTAKEAAQTLLGKYEGKWSLFGLDDKGQVALKASWEDTVEATDLVEKTDRVYVKVSSTMKFSGGASFNVSFTEGFLLLEDGQAGERFFCLNGTEVREHELGDSTWVFQTTATAQDLWSMGFKPGDVLESAHTTVKKLKL